MFVQKENLNTMFKLNDIIEMLKIDSSNKKDIFYLKILIDVLINEKIVSINKQKISIDINYLIKQWNLISNIGEYFDLSKLNKELLNKFVDKILVAKDRTAEIIFKFPQLTSFLFFCYQHTALHMCSMREHIYRCYFLCHISQFS